MTSVHQLDLRLEDTLTPPSTSYCGYLKWNRFGKLVQLRRWFQLENNIIVILNDEKSTSGEPLFRLPLTSLRAVDKGGLDFTIDNEKEALLYISAMKMEEKIQWMSAINHSIEVYKGGNLIDSGYLSSGSTESSGSRNSTNSSNSHVSSSSSSSSSHSSRKHKSKRKKRKRSLSFEEKLARGGEMLGSSSSSSNGGVGGPNSPMVHSSVIRTQMFQLLNRNAELEDTLAALTKANEDLASQLRDKTEIITNQDEQIQQLENMKSSLLSNPVVQEVATSSASLDLDINSSKERLKKIKAKRKSLLKSSFEKFQAQLEQKDSIINSLELQLRGMHKPLDERSAFASLIKSVDHNGDDDNSGNKENADNVIMMTTSSDLSHRTQNNASTRSVSLNVLDQLKYTSMNAFLHSVDDHQQQQLDINIDNAQRKKRLSQRTSTHNDILLSQEARITSLESLLEEKEAVIVQKDRQIEQIRSEIGDRDRDISQRDAQISQLVDVQISDLQRNVQSLNDQNTHLSLCLENAKTKYHSLKLFKQQTYPQLVVEVEKKRSKLSSLRSSFQSLRDEFDSLTAENRSLQNSSHSQSLQHAESLRSLESQLETSTLQLTSQLDLQTAELSQLTLQYQTTLATLTQSEATNHHLSQTISSLQSEIASLKSEIELRSAEFDRKTSESFHLHQSELLHVTQKLNEQLDFVQTLQSQRTRMKETIADLKTKLDAQNISSHNLLSEIEALRHSLQEKDADITKLTSQNHSLSISVDFLTSQNEKAAERFAAKAAECDDVSSQSTEQIERVRLQLTLAEQKVESLSALVAENEKTIEQSKHLIDEYKSAIALKNDLIVNLQMNGEQIDAAVRNLRSANEEISKLRDLLQLKTEIIDDQNSQLQNFNHSLRSIILLQSSQIGDDNNGDNDEEINDRGEENLNFDVNNVNEWKTEELISVLEKSHRSMRRSISTLKNNLNAWHLSAQRMISAFEAKKEMIVNIKNSRNVDYNNNNDNNNDDDNGGANEKISNGMNESPKMRKLYEICDSQMNTLICEIQHFRKSVFELTNSNNSLLKNNQILIQNNENLSNTNEKLAKENETLHSKMHEVNVLLTSSNATISNYKAIFDNHVNPTVENVQRLRQLFIRYLLSEENGGIPNYHNLAVIPGSNSIEVLLLELKEMNKLVEEFSKKCDGAATSLQQNNKFLMLLWGSNPKPKFAF